MFTKLFSFSIKKNVKVQQIVQLLIEKLIPNEISS